MPKRDHLQDFEADGSGGYTYKGDRWSWPKGTREPYLRKAALLFCGAVAAFLGAGWVPAPGTFGAFYVVMPYAVCALGLALCAAALIRIAREDRLMRDFIYQKTIPMLPIKLALTAVFAGICAVAALVHGFVVQPGAAFTMSLVFALLMMACCILLLLLLHQTQALNFKKKK